MNFLRSEVIYLKEASMGGGFMLSFYIHMRFLLTTSRNSPAVKPKLLPEVQTLHSSVLCPR